MTRKKLSSLRKIDFAIGGQAVIEGVMMRSPHFVVTAIRKPDGKIRVLKKPFKALTARLRISKIPILRGIAALIEALYLGIKNILFSNKAYYLGETEGEKSRSRKIAENIFLVIYLTFIFSLALFLFKYLPLFLTESASLKTEVVKNHYWLFNLIDALIKVVFLLLYIALISLIPDIRRVFAYHGAEHKAVFTYEKGLALTIKNAKPESTCHPRCGTSFILIVIILCVLVYTILPPDPSFEVKLLERILVLPLIAGISYEILKFSARHYQKWWMKILVKPGLLFQKITTREPDEKQLEVGLRALKETLVLERSFKTKNQNKKTGRN